MIPLHVLLGTLAGALLGHRRNEREWRKARASLDNAAVLWGERLREQDEREDRMVRLAERQVRLGWLSLAVAVGSITVAIVALVD